MRAVHFHSLSAQEQSEFVGATDAGSPLFVTAFHTRLSSGPNWYASAVSIVGVVVSIAALITTLAFGFGSPRDWGQADLGFLALYGLLFSALAYSIVFYAKNRARQTLPFATGTYILSADVVVAKADGMLTIYPLADAKVDLHEVKSRDERFSHLALVYADTKMLFVEEDAALASSHFERIKALQESPETSLFGASNNTEPAPVEARGLGARALVLTLGVGLLAVPTWYARNYLSDEAVFADIQSTTDLQLMHRYALESSSPHAPAARELWMERQFEEAGDDTFSLLALVGRYPEFEEGRWSERVRERRFELAQGRGPEPLVMFTEAYPDHAEGAAALQAAVVEETRRVNSMSALRSFVTDYPDAPESAGFRDDIALRYDNVTAVTDAAPEATRALVGALIAYSREHQSAELLVRFSPPRHYESSRIDRRHRHDSLPNHYERITPHMSAARCRHREEWFVKELNRRLGVHYPRGVLFAEYDGHDTRAANVPTLHVRYALVPYGLAAEIEDHLFERVHFDYEVTLQIPGQVPYRSELRTNPVEESALESDWDYPPPRFYDDEARSALQQLGRNVVEGIFGHDYSDALPIPFDELLGELKE